MTLDPSNPPPAGNGPQTLVALGVLLTGLALGWGAMGISSDAGYGGVGPNFLPWLCAVALVLCGAWLLWEARTGGFRGLSADGGEPANWSGFVWVSAGLLLNASLITTVGFILGCALCYLLAVQGFRRAQGSAVGGARAWITDALVGLAIASPVFWMFTKGLAISLPGLTQTGWI